jgi:hypothetical protein
MSRRAQQTVLSTIAFIDGAVGFIIIGYLAEVW